MSCEHTWPSTQRTIANPDDPNTYRQHRCNGQHEHAGGYELHVCRYCRARTS